MTFGFKVIFAIGVFGAGSRATAETVVTTYVTKVQEERKSTRFTLTEWLRIKERMKLMDVWLAMFSDPKKSAFQPELNLVFFKSKGKLEYTAINSTEDDSGDISGTQAKVQLYLTNLFSGSTGLRLLNIDFGVEGGLLQTDDYQSDSDVKSQATGKLRRTHYTGNFRLFGKNIQDSALIFKVGQYQVRNSFAKLDGTNDRTLRRGLALGGELQLYLFRWLGLEGNYLHYQPSSDDATGWSTHGSYYDYMAFIEVSLVRLMFGVYSNEWAFENDRLESSTKESGLLGGLKLQF